MNNSKQLLKNSIKLIVFSLLVISTSYASEIDDIKKSMMLNYIEQTNNNKIIKKENEQLIQQNSIYYKNIVATARKYYQEYIAKSWGEENVKLSTKKTFTQYSKDMKERENIDFEKGTVTLEIVTEVNKKIEPKRFEEKLKELKNENINQAIDKDPVAKLSKEYLKKKEIVKLELPKKEKDKFLKDLIENTKIKANQIKERIIELKDGKKKKIVSVVVQMVPKHLEKRAKRYKQDVFTQAKKFNVTPSHVFGTIQTESYFNPLAISHVPAYGLMQIVPSSAGKDAYEALTGKKRLLAPPYLYNAKNNIELGTKYIQIIKERYLAGITNKESLFYCTATSYNAGIGTLIKSFTGSYKKRKEAIRIINSMTPDEVYNHLRTSKRLTKEAKNYVKKLRNYSKNYLKWDL